METAMKSRISGRVFNFRVGAVVIGATLVACAQGGGDSLFQPGQLIFGGTRQIKDVQPVAGFLPDPSLLQPGGPGQAALVYRNATVNFAAYNKVFLDPVTIWTEPDSALNSVPESQRQAAADRFYSDLYNALSKHCQMVTSPAPGTMHLRVALTDATTPNALLNTVAHYAPYGISTAYSLASLAFNNGVGYFAGTAAAEGYATDAATGTLLWQAVDKRGGTTALVANTLNTWRDVDNAFRAWSDKLAARLQELGACGGVMP
jgi:hypothetical protein